MCFLLDLDQTCNTREDEYHAASTMNSVQNIKVDTKVKMNIFLSYLNGHDNLHTCDWKRLLHNMSLTMQMWILCMVDMVMQATRLMV